MKINKSTISQLFELIRTAYDNAFAGKSESDMYNLVELWYDCLKEYPQEVILQATKNAIKYSEFVPRIATVVREADALMQAYSPNEGALWNELKAAIDKVSGELPYMSGAYDTVKHVDTGLTTAGEVCRLIHTTYCGLNDKIKEYCGNERGFIDIARLDEEGLQFEKARFMKQLPILAERVKLKRNIPPQLADLIKGICESNERKLIGDGK